MIKINATKMDCPKPIILTKKALDAMKEGQTVTTVDNKMAVENLEGFAKSLGYEVSCAENAGLYEVTITKPVGEDAEDLSLNHDVVIQISTDKYGQGDDELGANLMKAYIYALTEVEPRPSKIMFINSGIKLSTEGSLVLDSLLQLEKEGTEILSCGACLNFYGLSEKLAVGGVTNMYAMVEAMHKASNGIKI